MISNSNCPDCSVEIRVSGWQAPHPEGYCAICGEYFWYHKILESDKVIGWEWKNTPPTKWGGKSKDSLIADNGDKYRRSR